MTDEEKEVLAGAMLVVLGAVGANPKNNGMKLIELGLARLGLKEVEFGNGSHPGEVAIPAAMKVLATFFPVEYVMVS